MDVGTRRAKLISSLTADLIENIHIMVSGVYREWCEKAKATVLWVETQC